MCKDFPQVSLYLSPDSQRNPFLLTLYLEDYYVIYTQFPNDCLFTRYEWVVDAPAACLVPKLVLTFDRHFSRWGEALATSRGNSV